MRCPSKYFGFVHIWDCRLPEGHADCHKGDKYKDGRGYVYDEDYTSWTDADAADSFIEYIERGGNK